MRPAGLPEDQSERIDERVEKMESDGEVSPEEGEALAEKLLDHKHEILGALKEEEQQSPLRWPEKSLRNEREFGHSSARLYPFNKKTVWTKAGECTLLQVSPDGVTVAFPDAPDKAADRRFEDVVPVDPKEVGISFEEVRKAFWSDAT